MLTLLLLILWPVAEVYVAIKVAEAIGVLLTVLALIAGWPVGTRVLRSRGRAAWTRLRADVAAGRPPGKAVLDGALILTGGLLLMVPGFISDVVGIVLLLPPSRGLMRRLAERRLGARMLMRAARFGQSARGYDVDSTATDLDQPQLRR